MKRGRVSFSSGVFLVLEKACRMLRISIRPLTVIMTSEPHVKGEVRSEGSARVGLIAQISSSY